MIADLTGRQREILDYIRSFIESEGFPPSYREIGEAFGIVSPNGIKCHLKALEKKGCIKVYSRTARGIQLIDEPLPDVDIEFDRLNERIGVLLGTIRMLVGTDEEAEAAVHRYQTQGS